MALTFGAKQTYTTPGGGNQALYNSSCSLDATHFVVAWRDLNDSDKGKCVVGTVSGSTVTYGTIVTFNAADTRNPFVCKIDSTHFAVAFRDTGDSGKGKAMIATVASGDVITFGAEYTFAAGTVNNPSIALLDSTHLVVSYDDVTNTDGSAIVGTISSTDVISFGTRVAFVATSINGSRIAVLDSTHFAVVFKGESNEYVKSIVGVVSAGTTITFGTAVSVLADNSNSADIATIDSTHFLVGYTDNTAGVASGNVGTVTSGDSISIGTKYSAAINLNEIMVRVLTSTTFYFCGITGGTVLNANTGTLSGSVISYDTAVAADSGSNGYDGSAVLSSTTFVITYSNTDGSPVGTAKIGSISSVYTLTADAGAYALTGIDVAIQKNLHATMETGSHTLTGNNIDLWWGVIRTMIMETGSYILTGIDILFGGQRYANDTKPTNSYSNDTKPTSSYSNDTKPTSSYSNDTKPSSSYSNDTKPSNSWINDEKL